MSEPLLRFREVSKVYSSQQQALQNVSFRLTAGEMVFLTGHSGAGKSTILRLSSGIEQPTSGSIEFNGRDITRLARKERPYLRRQTGLIFQDHRLLMQYSAFDNVALPLRVCGESEMKIRKRVMAALDQVGLHDRAEQIAGTLSGGEQQRVGIARAIVVRPRVLLADEPTGNLDPELSMDILRLFAELNDYGTAVMIATHDLGLIARMRYRNLTLRQGRLLNPSYDDLPERDTYGA